jgi:hypothetical protein
MAKKNLSLNSGNEEDASSIARRMIEHVKLDCKHYSLAEQCRILREISKRCSDKADNLDMGKQANLLRYKASQELTQRILDGDSTVDIPYFTGSRGVIRYFNLRESPEKNESLSGNLTPLFQVLRHAGYLHVSSHCIVRESHIVNLDNKYVYVDTYERIPLGKVKQKAIEEELERLRKKVQNTCPDWEKEKGNYRDCRFL